MKGNCPFHGPIIVFSFQTHRSNCNYYHQLNLVRAQNQSSAGLGTTAHRISDIEFAAIATTGTSTATSVKLSKTRSKQLAISTKQSNAISQEAPSQCLYTALQLPTPAILPSSAAFRLRFYTVCTPSPCSALRLGSRCNRTSRLCRQLNLHEHRRREIVILLSVVDDAQPSSWRSATWFEDLVRFAEC